MNSPIDMSAFIAAKSDQLNADDLAGGPRTITITGVRANTDSAEQPISIHFEGDDNKPFKPCKTVRRIMVGVWGSNASNYIGRSMTLYRDGKVSFGGMQVGGIRISHMSHMEREMIVAANSTRGKKAAHKIFPLKTEERPQQSSSQRSRSEPMTAEQWTADHIAFVAGAADLERLASLQNSGKKWVDQLPGINPELHQRVVDAYAKRLDELSGEDPAQ